MSLVLKGKLWLMKQLLTRLEQSRPFTFLLLRGGKQQLPLAALKKQLTESLPENHCQAKLQRWIQGMERQKLPHTSRRRQETHSLFCALIPGQVFLSLNIQSWLECRVLDLRWLWAHTGSPWSFGICDLHWSNLGTFCSPNSEVDLMFILAAEFHISTHRIHQRDRSRSSLDLKPNGISRLFFFFSLPLSLSFPIHAPLVSAFTPSASATIPEFQTC